MEPSSDDVLLRIARCPIVDSCLASGTRSHACSEIVSSQKANDAAEFKVPEPWSGNIENAPILFLSSNPTIDTSPNNPENYPTSAWPDDRIADYFKNRFGGGAEAWTNGLRSQRLDGSYSHKVPYWSAVDARASELLERRPVPGVDYALSEVVHCKSDGERGVGTALQECAPRWLPMVLERAGAAVIVCLGTRARAAIREVVAVPEERRLHKTRISGRMRALVFLPHPNARMPRTFKACAAPQELADLQALCRKAARTIE